MPRLDEKRPRLRELFSASRVDQTRETNHMTSSPIERRVVVTGDRVGEANGEVAIPRLLPKVPLLRRYAPT